MATSSSWDEVKRLAADFQKAQLSSTSQRLSERNCIEIVSKLIELKLIDVIFTNDGKEYLTAQQLVKEIRDELYVREGRVNIVELAKELNVDLNKINLNITEIVKGKEVQLISGSLITSNYLEKIASEINEKLQFQGHISVSDLTLQYDLPADLLQHGVLEKYLGKIIIGKQDPSDNRIFYTEEFIMRTKAKIRGALIGLLKPTPINFILSYCNLNERLFLFLFDQLQAPGMLTGKQSNAFYVPSCYTKSQNEWVMNFYRQNNYLEYDALTRLGISDPKVYIKRILANEDNIYLSSCVIGTEIKQQVETALEECISSKSYLDIVSLLPSVLSDEDIESVLDSLLKNNSKSTILFKNTVFSNHFVNNLKLACLSMIQKKAESVVKSGKFHEFYLDKQYNKTENQQLSHLDHKAERREERRKKASSGKGGGGTQGRETKTKAVKKHPRSKHIAHDSDSDESPNNIKKSQTHLEIITVQDIENIIKESLEDEGLDELLIPISEYLQGHLNEQAITIAKEVADKLLQDVNQTRKQTHSSAQDRINVIVNDIKLYEKGIKIFPKDQHAGFIKYLFKTLGNELLTEFFKYAASQCNLSLQAEVLTIQQRNKLLNDIPYVYLKPLRALNSTLSEQSMELFYVAVDACLSECGMILKKVDKKKDKLLIQNHREKLISEMEGCDQPALVLHFVVLILFTLLNQNMLSASGKQVPIIIEMLKTRLKEEDFEKLQKYHELVSKYLVENNQDKNAIEEKLKEDMGIIKNLVYNVQQYK